MKAMIAGVLAFPVLFLVLLAIPMLSDGDDITPASCTPSGDTRPAPSAPATPGASGGPDGSMTAVPREGDSTGSSTGGGVDGTSTGTTAPVTSIPGFNAEQVRDAAAVVAAGKALNVPPRGIAIGLMTAYGESNLMNIGYGDAAGPDSRGIFQQRGNGAWGTLEERMNPTMAAAHFFQKLIQVPGWRSMEPTLAAHAVQANADAYYYAQYWSIGVRLFSALEGTGAADLADPSQVVCAPPDAGTSNVQFTPSGIAYVGQFDPTELMNRARVYQAAGGQDPYFHSSNGSWYRACQHFVANLSGRYASGFDTAADAWAHFQATGAAHPATASDGEKPPIGAWLYYQGSSSAGHVTVYLGNGMAASTDLPTSGRVGIVRATDPITVWHQTYLGWAAPWAEPGTGSHQPA